MTNQIENKVQMGVKTAQNIMELAIRNVATVYISQHLPWKRGEQMQTERSFAYELYHQWSKLNEYYYKIHSNESPVLIQGEITKEMKSLSGRNQNWFPDLVLHEGQNSVQNQLMVCEIKRFLNNKPDQKSIKNDLKKLLGYMNLMHSFEENKDSNFKSAVFLGISLVKEDLEDGIKSLLRGNKKLCKELKAHASEIWCYCVYQDNDRGFCDFEKIQLSKIIKEVER